MEYYVAVEIDFCGGSLSTPCGTQKQPYGVLHVAVEMDHCGGSLSTPYGTKNQPYGVLHKA